ncbi:MAG: nitroreductase/quinone reductase family protein [Miltoncostaeaceae bacterium]
MSEMPDMAEMNRQIAAEFRANAGKVGGMFEGAPMCIITTTGAKSGKTRENPLMYRPDGDRYVIFASAAGGPKNPSWYHNAVANPGVVFEVGADKFDASVTELEGEERERLWEAQKAEVPQFAEYERMTDRVIPLLAISRD